MLAYLNEYKFNMRNSDSIKILFCTQFKMKFQVHVLLSTQFASTLKFTSGN